MPECYTHTVIAFQAMEYARQVVPCEKAFIAGANGFDIFKYYKPSNKKQNQVFQKLRKRLQTEKTGEFLKGIVSLATTPEQQSYVLGFVTYYAADCIMNPFIKAMCESEMPYHQKNGVLWLESSIDTWLAKKNINDTVAPLEDRISDLCGEELAQIVNLLRGCVLQVYGLDIPAVKFADSFHGALKVRKKLTSKRMGGKFLALKHLRLFPWKSMNYLKSLSQPAPELKTLPEIWQNPYSKVEYNVSLDALLKQAAQGASVCVQTTIQYWLGEISLVELEAVLGNNNYKTGLPIEIEQLVEKHEVENKAVQKIEEHDVVIVKNVGISELEMAQEELHEETAQVIAETEMLEDTVRQDTQTHETAQDLVIKNTERHEALKRRIEKRKKAKSERQEKENTL